uniref:Reverse transcriptase Ty1/copia-type domain-containing protein n=1 Tax=Solanum lycopersicum TaxID=4081 RepID=A0A3Q7HMA1_SOLLC
MGQIKSLLGMDQIIQLGKEFPMKGLGPLHFFLGVEMKYFEREIHLNQSKYVVELLDKIEMTLAKAVATPLAQKHGLHEVVGSLVDVSFYKMIVRSLQYLTFRRHDITHLLNIEHLQGVKRILKYIKGTLHFGLRIISQSPCRLYDTQVLIGEIVPPLRDQLQAITST